MWKTALTQASRLPTLLDSTQVLHQQLRTTFILKRRFPARLHKKGMEEKILRGRNYIYDLVKNENLERQPDMEVILTEYVEGLGNEGEKVALRPNFAYNNLLLPGLAVYATPENLKKYESFDKREKQVYSSAYAMFAVRSLSTLLLYVIMNKENAWTIKPWHIRANFRKAGYIVPDEAIILPDTPITGPNMENEGKQFFITVKINNMETARVRCILHHWSTDIADRTYVPKFWEQPLIPLLPEQAEEFRDIN